MEVCSVFIGMDNIRTKCSWGYSTPYFIAGCYGAHVNNIAYLTQKNSIRSKDIRYILNKIGAIPRKRYDYNLLSNVRDNPMELNEEIHSMLEDYKATRNSHTKIQFITPSRFSEIFDEGIQ